jgi:sulfur carrier protein
MTVVLVNGEPTSVTEGITVSQLVADRVAGGSGPRGRRGTAVAVNGVVVPRSEWDSTRIDADDAIEILDAVGGG